MNDAQARREVLANLTHFLLRVGLDRLTPAARRSLHKALLAASKVEAAADLDAARTAAEEISAQCQACHTAAGVNMHDGGG